MSIKNNYKLAHARVFGSAENLYQNFKNYRSVYDEAECTYLYAEFAFYNKKFDEGDWTTDITFKCFDTETESLVCTMSKSYQITQDTNIFYAREGWGTPNPGWWKKGVYRWDAFIEGELVGSTTFYIANLGLVTAQANPYLQLDALKLFGTHNGYESNIDARVYKSGFNVGTLNYLNVELTYTIHPTERPFPLEFQINYYNDAGLFKAALTYLKNIDLADAQQIADIAYGSATGGFWLEDNYRVEVLFMGELLAVAHFNVGQSDVPHDGSLPFDPSAKVIVNNTPSDQNPVQNTSSKPPLPPKPTFEEATAALQKLIGLDSVKKQLDEFSTYLQFLQIRKKKGFEETEKFNMHTAFVGNPGTGKTTVAKMLGQIYYSLDLLSKGHVHEVGRADLVGEFIGQTAPKTQKAIEKARGGILFIDEAYALSDRGTSDNDFGKEVIECLLKEMSDGKGDIAVVFAGYPKQMKAFLESNPGMSSRISSTIAFPDYMPDELMQIAQFAAEKKLIILDEAAKTLLHRKFVEYYRTRDKHFGNARFVHGVVEECKENMAIRLMRGGANLEELDKDALSTVILEDVEKAFGMSLSKQAHIPIDEPMFAEALAELHALVGMPELKRQVDEMAKLVRYYTEIGRDVRKAFSLHTVFTGNPGTGKTTVARIITKIYKSLGILEKGHLIETDREGLVAGYVGQTAIKTNEAIESALGGCLFIDEAYALNEGKGSTHDLGGEAIDTLLKRMEDKRGEFMVIAAGYPEEMQAFLANNPGLLSRFDKTFHFTDYSEPELLDICVDMFEAESLVLSEEAVGVIQKYIAVLLQNKHKYFGNARTIRKIVKEVVQRQNLRLAHLPAAERTREQIRTVIPADIQGIQLMEQSEQPNRKMIGFGK